jgi:hypothetical protein
MKSGRQISRPWASASENRCEYSAAEVPAGKGTLSVHPAPSPAPVSLAAPVPG